MSTTATIAVMRALPKSVAYARKDLAKRFSLLEDWEITINKPFPAVYDSFLLHAEAHTLKVKRYISTKEKAICDGNTLVPEQILGIKTVIGALVHDPLYLELEAFAKAMGWTIAKTRLFADAVFGNILLQLARREPNYIKRKIGIAWAHISYAGVRALGGFAHWLYATTALILIATLATGCSGCMQIVVEDEWATPNYEQTEGGNNDNGS